MKRPARRRPFVLTYRTSHYSIFRILSCRDPPGVATVYNFANSVIEQRPADGGFIGDLSVAGIGFLGAHNVIRFRRRTILLDRHVVTQIHLLR